VKRLLVVDGLDGCGKDTHARRIARLMAAEGVDVTIVSHPSGRWFGRLSKRALQSSGHAPRAIATLFYTLDVLVSVARYNRAREGTFVFVRYLLGTAYLPRRLVPAGYKFFRNLLPFPDLAIFIDIEPSVALRRIEARDHRREMFETREKLEAVRRVAKGLTSEEWTVIDNSEDGEAPFARLAEVLASRGLVGSATDVSPGAP
jgi:dTMP kinase